MPPTSLDLEREILAATVNMSILPKSARLRFRFIRGKIFPREPSTPFVNKPD